LEIKPLKNIFTSAEGVPTEKLLKKQEILAIEVFFKLNYLITI